MTHNDSQLINNYYRLTHNTGIYLMIRVNHIVILRGDHSLHCSDGCISHCSLWISTAHLVLPLQITAPSLPSNCMEIEWQLHAWYPLTFYNPDHYCPCFQHHNLDQAFSFDFEIGPHLEQQCLGRFYANEILVIPKIGLLMQYRVGYPQTHQ